MKLPISFKALILVLSLLCSGIYVRAQNDYFPLVEEGKVWNYGDDAYPGSTPEYSYYIAGDTVIAGDYFKKLYKQTHDNGIILYHAAIRENEKRVSVIMADNNEAKPLYDFSLSSGSIFVVDNMAIGEIQQLRVI